MYDLAIINGTVVDSRGSAKATVCVKNGVFAALQQPSAPVTAARTVDARGLLVFPGMVDGHAHLNDPGFTWREDFFCGTAAAAAGGVTTVIDMPLQNKPAMASVAIMDKKIRAVSGKAAVDFCLWGALIDNPDDLVPLAKAGCVALKSFLSPVDKYYVTLGAGPIYRALQVIKKYNIRAGFHCEDYSMIRALEAAGRAKSSPTWKDYLESRPVVAELIATKNILDLAEATGAKVHICHVSHPDVARAIYEAQQRGVDVTAETCGHYLVFTQNDLLKKGGPLKCAPPLRDKAASEGLWKYLENGTLSCIGSDHSPCELREKDASKLGVFDVWGGISGIQSTFQTVYSEAVVKRKLSPSFVARVLAKNPAQTFGIYGKKGDIALGFDADFVLFNPTKKWTITAKSLLYLNKFSAFEGLRGTGLPQSTFVRGNLVAQGGAFVGKKGYGRLVKRLGA